MDVKILNVHDTLQDATHKDNTLMLTLHEHENISEIKW
jgi:hypothetical protein